MRKARKGQIVYLTDIAIENYGEEWDGKPLIIERVATRYMPAKQFYAQGMPEGFHPGYDEGVGGNLYDLITEDGEDFPVSVYDWEITF